MTSTLRNRDKTSCVDEPLPALLDSLSFTLFNTIRIRHLTQIPRPVWPIQRRIVPTVSYDKIHTKVMHLNICFFLIFSYHALIYDIPYDISTLFLRYAHWLTPIWSYKLFNRHNHVTVPFFSTRVSTDTGPSFLFSSLQLLISAASGKVTIYLRQFILFHLLC